MKLFFDPIKNNPEAEILDEAVTLDLQLEEILHNCLHDRDMEQATFRVAAEFCNDSEIIYYRQGVVGDLIYFPELFDTFHELRTNLWEMRILYELNMFKTVPEMKSMKTFLVIEKFYDIYTALLSHIENFDTSKLSKEMKKIIEDIRSEENKRQIQSVYNDIKGLRDSLETIGEIRLNRYFSRGQNVENSIISKTDAKSLNQRLIDASEALDIDTSIGKESAILSEKEFARPVFKALYNLYYDIFKNIDDFHEKYTDYFDTSWFDLIFKFDAALGFAMLFKQLKDKGFAICKGKVAPVTKIHDFYSMFLTNRDLTPEQVVSNDFITSEKTSFFFITGPNAGGKTIFLSALGLSQLFFQAFGFLPAVEGEIKVMKRMFTHFPVEEYNDKSGRLVEEQGRVETIFRHVTDNECLALFNETYSSTKADIAYKLSVELTELSLKHNVSGVFVTHLHSLRDYALETKDRDISVGVLTALHDHKTGSRTFKIVPLSDQNSSYAIDILEKYNMTVDQMINRLKNKEKEDVENVSRV